MWQFTLNLSSLIISLYILLIIFLNFKFIIIIIFWHQVRIFFIIYAKKLIFLFYSTRFSVVSFHNLT